MNRREFLKAAGAAAAALAAGCNGLETAEKPPPAPPPRSAGYGGPIFDAHTHVVVGVPGTAGSVERLRESMKAANVDGALVMASTLLEAAIPYAEERTTPIGLSGLEKIAEHLAPRGPLVPFAFVNPHRADAAALARTRDAARRGLLRGLKIGLGYYRVWAADDRYRPFYKLADDLGLPVMFHTGDVYDKKGHLKYAQPLTVDEVAVEFPSVRFILAHLGNPWTLEAAEVVYKNENVYADISAFAVGDEDYFRSPEKREVLDDVVARVRQAFLYAEAPGRFLHGSDWPLVPMEPYADLMRRAIPEGHHAAVFRENARKLFGV